MQPAGQRSLEPTAETRTAETRTAETDEWLPLDEAYATYLDSHPVPPGGSLLAQTILTGRVRRSVLRLVGVQSGADLLDIGTGFGPVVLEAAHVQPVRGIGVDLDLEVLEVAKGVCETVRPWLFEGASVHFGQASAAALPFRDESFDVATARLLFQHLPDPRKVVAELWRVLRYGGSVLAFDVDDGLSITYPPPTSELAALEDAFSACQAQRGGDREIGRKLTTYLAEGGFRIANVQLIAQAQHQASSQGDASRTVNAARLGATRDEIIHRELLSADEFDRCLEAYVREPPVERFRAEAQLLVVAEKR